MKDEVLRVCTLFSTEVRSAKTEKILTDSFICAIKLENVVLDGYVRFVSIWDFIRQKATGQI
jgi:hypothetical protein